VVRPANLKRKLALLAVLVVAGHIVGLEWIAREIGQITGLKLMTPPMYTRTLAPAAPPPVVAVAPAPEPEPVPPQAYAAPPRPPASSPEELRRKREAAEAARREAQERERQETEARAEADARALADALARAEADRRAREDQLAQAAEAAASAAADARAAASGPVAAAAPPAGAASTAAAPAAAASGPGDASGLAQWPVDTRLTYVLTGMYRGPLYGDARVQWQREGGKYQVRLDCNIQVFGSQVLTSQGDVTPNGLVPHAYEELRPGKRRMARIGDQAVTLDNGRTVPRPPGVQDTASQFVELTQRFATGREVLQVGRSIKLWLARPGGVDQWEYDIVGQEPVVTPRFGTVDAFHLKPRKITNPRGNINVEMWFAPSLQYLPARIKLTMGDDTWLDLVVDHIDQR
jgi:hypothetical protein